MFAPNVVSQLGVLEQVVQHDLGDRVPLEGDHDPHADAIGRFVVDVGDPRDPARRGPSCAMDSMRLSGLT